MGNDPRFRIDNTDQNRAPMPEMHHHRLLMGASIKPRWEEERAVKTEMERRVRLDVDDV
jgi:hypothetical protein